jgi:serine/threonine-protein kinase
MAPEQAEGKPVDQRADVFSFGAVLYEMVSGVQPFQRDSASGTVAAILRDEPPALDAARVPAAIRQVIERALQKNPEARYASGGELAAALAPESPVVHRSARNRRWLVAGAAAAVVVAAGLGGWNLYNKAGSIGPGEDLLNRPLLAKTRPGGVRPCAAGRHHPE